MSLNVWLAELCKKIIGDGILVAMASAVVSYFIIRFIRDMHTNATIKNILQTYLEQEKYQKTTEEYLIDENDAELADVTALFCQEQKSGMHLNTILLYGPPGTGKTSFVRWLSGKHNYPVYEVSKIAYSCTEKGLSEIDVLQKVINYIHANKKQGQISIIFIDEFETMCESKPFVHQFFANFGEANRPGKQIILFATTNQNPAIIHEKIRQRFEKIILIGNSLEKTVSCFSLYLKIYCNKNISPEHVVARLRHYTHTIESTLDKARMLSSIERGDTIQEKKSTYHPLKAMCLEVEKLFATFFDPEQKVILVPPRNVVNMVKGLTQKDGDFPSFATFDKIMFCGKVEQLQHECSRLQKGDSSDKKTKARISGVHPL